MVPLAAARLAAISEALNALACDSAAAASLALNFCAFTPSPSFRFIPFSCSRLHCLEFSALQVGRWEKTPAIFLSLLFLPSSWAILATLGFEIVFGGLWRIISRFLRPFFI
jgi:hypothetical protein